MKGIVTSATPGDISYLNHMTLSSWSNLGVLPDGSFTPLCTSQTLRTRSNVHRTDRAICYICLRRSLVFVSLIAEVAGVSPPHLDANVIKGCGEKVVPVNNPSPEYQLRVLLTSVQDITRVIL